MVQIREGDRFSPRSLAGALESVGRAATSDLTSPSRVPQNLYRLVRSGKPRVARIALSVAYELSTGDGSGLRSELDLAPLFAAAVCHDSWWVRLHAARSLCWYELKPALASALIDDPVPAVSACAARVLQCMPLSKVLRVLDRMDRGKLIVVARSLMASIESAERGVRDFEAWVRGLTLKQDERERLIDWNAQQKPESTKAVLHAIDPTGSLRNQAAAVTLSDLGPETPPQEVALMQWVMPWDSWLRTVTESLAIGHPSPLVRELLADWIAFLGDSDYCASLLHTCLSDADEGVVASCSLGMYLPERSIAVLKPIICRLMARGHLLITQALARALYGYSAASCPDPDVVGWLKEMVVHSDALVRLRALVSLRGLARLSSMTPVVSLLLQRWHAESGPVKLRLAEVLQRALPSADWLGLVGAELLRSPERHARLLALELWDTYCTYEPHEAAQAVASVVDASLRRRLRARLSKVEREGTMWEAMRGARGHH